MPRQPKTPEEFQRALIHSLEAIQAEVGAVIAALKFRQEGVVTVRNPIVFPMAGKMCMDGGRVTTRPKPAAGRNVKPARPA